ncbi:MAG: polysaccharide deacetylase family protein [Candidatus Komeilibacteria bacterium]|nr:polysaccharide deacetylase family protein [Candidatus Komeilibacteria bacterium]
MRTFFRNILIVLSYLTSIPFWTRLALKKPLVRVWCLHEVKDNQVWYFLEKLSWLKKNYNVLTPEQFKNRQFSTDRINVLLTFDDGYESWFRNVLSILNEENVKAVFFINNEFLSQSSKLTDAGHTLGGHSVSHERLTQLPADKLTAEVSQSVKSDFFAYPYGDKQSFNDAVIDEVKKAGYQYGFTILPGFNNLDTNPYLLHRDSLDPNVPNFIFKLWLKGNYDLWKKLF